ncbi:tripartite tricarboxylate transporter TctB family protein [Ancylobacter terrae]|uniref:tripartite tricarboxylate transporter TctB family protein n=1 Tax=Ancylobacter sp. sgz301288 TaxID=3342077 RepID=UPI003859E244
MPMRDDTPSAPPPARPWLVGAGVLAMGLVWLYGATGIESTTSYIGIGPSAMVGAVGAGLVVLGVLLLIQIAGGETFRPQEEENTDVDAPPSRKAFLLALAGVAVPLATIKWLGFPITAALGFVLVTHAFESRRTVFDFVIGLIVGVGCWYFFSKLGIDLGPFLPMLTGR